MLSDCWRKEERGGATALYSLMPFLGPAIGPIGERNLLDSVKTMLITISLLASWWISDSVHVMALDFLDCLHRRRRGPDPGLLLFKRDLRPGDSGEEEKEAAEKDWKRPTSH